MKIDKYEKKSQGKYRLYLDNGEVIDTYDDVILNQNLLLKKEITLEDINQLIVDSDIQESYNSCVKYITIRLRSKKEITDYLKRKQVQPDHIAKIFAKLEKKNFLDDALFAKCFINDKLKFTSWGPYRIINELKKHNLDPTIQLSLSEYLDYDIIYNKLSHLIDKSIKANHKAKDYTFKNKLYLKYFKQGYEASMIKEILDQKL